MLYDNTQECDVAWMEKVAVIVNISNLRDMPFYLTKSRAHIASVLEYLIP